MNKNNYNQVFVLPDGSETKVLDSYMGRYLQIPIQRIYQNPEHQKDNHLMDDKWKNLDCRKVEVFKNYINRETLEPRPAIETMVIAENKDWVDYPLVKSYTGEKACNCEYYTKVEVILMDDEYSRRLFFDWKGTLSAYDFMTDCAERILDEILEKPDKYYAKINDEDSRNPVVVLQFYSDDGEAVDIEIEGERDIENRIVSVRVVEFVEKIIDENKK